MAGDNKLAQPSAAVRMRRLLRFARTRLRELRMIGKALASTKHPILVHVIPNRRCNLACTYCNEFDDFSKPVPAAEICRRVDRLSALGTSIITISGGEPLLHPALEQIIRHIRKRGIIAGMITNGYLLTRERILSLNDAGLEHLKGLKNLRILSLVGTQITDAGLESLKDLENLQELYVAGTKVTEDGVKKLTEALPKLKIAK